LFSSVSLAEAEQGSDYRLMPGDVLEIAVWKEQDMQRQVRVRPDGKVSFPLAGHIQAAGNTPEQLEAIFTEKLGKFIPDVVVNVSTHADRHAKLKQKVDDICGFDFLLIDSPPSLGLLTVNILLATTEVVIPVSLTYLALDGCAEILDTINVVSRNFGHNSLHVGLVVPTFFNDTILVQSIMNKLKNHFGDKLSKTVIKYDMKLDQAQSFGRTIFDFAPDSLGAAMMGDVAKEVLEIVR